MKKGERKRTGEIEKRRSQRNQRRTRRRKSWEASSPRGTWEMKLSDLLGS